MKICLDSQLESNMLKATPSAFRPIQKPKPKPKSTSKGKNKSASNAKWKSKPEPKFATPIPIFNLNEVDKLEKMETTKSTPLSKNTQHEWYK